MASDLAIHKAFNLLQELLPGEDWSSQDMIDTAKRWCRMMEELSRKETYDFNFTTFDNPGHDELVLVRDISFSTLCSHHLLPFYGVCHVAYIPNGKIVGLSKIPRLVDHISHGTWTQEGLTQRIANVMEETLNPVGVAVIMPNVVHTCMSVRGVQERHASTTTSAMKGAFSDHDRLARAELLALLKL